MKPKYKEGDWVRFMYSCRLVIGVIQYVKDRRSFDADYRYVTDVGEVHEKSVLECRRLAE